MTPNHLAKIKRILLEMRRSPQGRKSIELEGLARALGRQRDSRGKEPTYIRANAPALMPPLSIPAHSADLKAGTTKSIVSVLLNDVAIWELFLLGESDE